MQKKNYRYDPKVNNFAIGGRYASRVETIRITKGYIAAKKGELQKLGRQFVNSEITAYDFRTKAAIALKQIHIANATLAKPKLVQSDLEGITELLKQQLYAGQSSKGKPFGIKSLSQEVIGGLVTEKRLLSRLNLYAEAGKVSQYSAQKSQAIARGKTEARRIRMQDERSCPECIIYEGMGWVGISQVVLPKTKCSCMNNCRCRLEFR